MMIEELLAQLKRTGRILRTGVPALTIAITTVLILGCGLEEVKGPSGGTRAAEKYRAAEKRRETAMLGQTEQRAQLEEKAVSAQVAPLTVDLHQLEQRWREIWQYNPHSYRIVDRKLHDSVAKTQVQLRAVVSGDLDSLRLRATLLEIYYEAQKTSSFKNNTRWTKNGRPSHVLVHLFPSEEHFEHGFRWAAMLAKTPASAVEITIQEDMVMLLKGKPEINGGFSEFDRRRLFKELYRIEGLAMKKAEAKYPSDDYKCIDEQRRLKKMYESDLMKNEDFGEAVKCEILNEGVTKRWPFF